MDLLLLSSRQSLPKRGLVAQYPFTDGSGQTLTDISGNGNNGTLGSTSGADASDPTWGSNLLTAGGTQYVRTPVTPTLQGTQIVVFKPTTVDATVRHLMSSYDGANGRAYLAHQNGHLLVGIGTAAPAGTATLVSGTWYMATHTWDGTRNKAYLNTTNDVNAAQSGLPNTTFSFCLEGINNNGTPAGGFVGSMGYALYYNRVLSAQEVQQVYRYLLGVMRGRGITL